MQNLDLEREAPVTNVDAHVAKPRRRRFTKLKAAELAGLPGAIPTGSEPVERDLAFVQFVVPVSGLVGMAAESGDIVQFASALDEQGKTLGVGEVSKVGFSDGAAEVVLKLDALVDPANHGAAAADAFRRLNDFLTAAPALHVERAGRRATWRAKINGTTIADGRY